jgi:hypothetical protein
MQLSLEFHDKSSVPPAIEEIIRTVNAFRFKIGWVNYVTTNATPMVHTIPSHLTTLPAINEWIYANHTPGWRDVLATIAATDTRVVLNVQHSVGDSRYLVGLYKHLSPPPSPPDRHTSASRVRLSLLLRADLEKRSTHEMLHRASNFPGFSGKTVNSRERLKIYD